MKRSGTTLSAFIFLIFLGMAQPAAVITFDKEVHDYGRITTTQAPDGKIEFKVYNKGEAPLLLTSVRACCGTLVKEFSSQPIAPRDSGIVKVEFRILERPHRISRTVTIQSNAQNRPIAILRITGEVIEPPDNSLKLD